MGTLNNANVAANVYAVVALLAFCRLLDLRTPRRNGIRRRSDKVRFWFCAAMLPLAWGAIVATGSRTTIVTVAAMSALLIALRVARARGRQRSGGIMAVVVAMMLLALLATRSPRWSAAVSTRCRRGRRGAGCSGPIIPTSPRPPCGAVMAGQLPDGQSALPGHDRRRAATLDGQFAAQHRPAFPAGGRHRLPARPYRRGRPLYCGRSAWRCSTGGCGPM